MDPTAQTTNFRGNGDETMYGAVFKQDEEYKELRDYLPVSLELPVLPLPFPLPPLPLPGPPPPPYFEFAAALLQAAWESTSARPFSRALTRFSK